MFFSNFNEKTIYNIIIVIFIFVGFLYVIFDKQIPENYAVIVAFCTFKIISNYRKCTFSYLECKLRKVKKHDGVLASFLDHVVNIRDTNYKYFIYVISAILLVHTEKLQDNLQYLKSLF